MKLVLLINSGFVVVKNTSCSEKIFDQNFICQCFHFSKRRRGVIDRGS